MEQPDIWVKVSRELLAKLGEWSQPVQVQVIDLGQGRGSQEPRYDMIFRTVPKEGQQ